MNNTRGCATVKTVFWFRSREKQLRCDAIFWAILKIIHSVICLSLGNTMIAFPVCSLPTACLQRAVSLSLQLENRTITQWSKMTEEGTWKETLWWLSYFISASQFFNRHLLKSCNQPLSLVHTVTALFYQSTLQCAEPTHSPFWSKPLKIN